MTVLRRFNDADAILVAEYCGAYDLAKMTARIPHPYTAEMAEELCTFSQGPDGRNWAITEDGDDLIGMIGSSLNGDEADIGYWIGAPFTGHGHATKAIALLLDNLFADAQITKINARVFEDNPASARVLIKSGFVRGSGSESESIARGPGTFPDCTYSIARCHWATPVLQTKRLTLRPFRGSDIDRLHTLIDDLDVARMLSPVPHPYSRALAEEWISGALWNKHDIHFVLDDGSGLIGACGIGPSSNGKPMIGFWLGQQYWGNGLMTEAATAMVSWAFTEQDTAQLVSYAFIDNFAFQRIHEKLGFAAGETVEQFSAARGEVIHAISYAFERDDWQAKQ